MRNYVHRIVITAAAIMLAAGAPPAVAAPPAEVPPRAQLVRYYQGGQLVGEGFWDCDGQFAMLWGVQAVVRTVESVPLACPGGIDP